MDNFWLRGELKYAREVVEINEEALRNSFWVCKPLLILLAVCIPIIVAGIIFRFTPAIVFGMTCISSSAGGWVIYFCHREKCKDILKESKERLAELEKQFLSINRSSLAPGKGDDYQRRG